jgi:hypothetical protein
MVQILSVRMQIFDHPGNCIWSVAYSDNYDKLDTGVVAGRLELAELVMPSSVTYPMRPLAFNNLYYHQATMTMTDNLATLLNFHFGGPISAVGSALVTSHSSQSEKRQATLDPESISLSRLEPVHAFRDYCPSGVDLSALRPVYSKIS